MNKYLNRILGVAILFVILVGFAAQGNATYYRKTAWSRISATAGEALAIGDLVCIADADGYAYKADADLSTRRPAIGVVGNTTASGSTAEIVTSGIFSGWSSLTEGAPAYISSTGGAITQTAVSAYSQVVAIAISTTEYMIQCCESTNNITALGTLSADIVMEGATADAYETTIAPTDATADRTITLPDASGVPILNSAVPEAANAVSGGTGTLIFEGATADAYETSLAVTDATADRTITLPDYTGDVPVIISQDYTSHSANNTTTDGTSVTVPANVLAAGKALRFIISGTCTGANAAKNVIIYIDDAAIVTLATAAADVGDWSATFVIGEHTDYANQKVFGSLQMGDTIVHLTDYATDTSDFSGAITVKTQVVSGDAGDTIVQEMGIVEFLP